MKKLKNIAIIMDGNGRWAKNQGKSRSYGHEKGSKILLECAKWAKEHEVESITYYAFSTENWKRSEKEINFLFKLPIRFFDKYFQEFIDEGICVKIIGNRKMLPKKLNDKLDEVENLTKNNTNILVNLAINYGSRDEIIFATKKIAQKLKSDEITLEDINEDLFSKNLYYGNDIDLVIRTGGEYRVSNFLLWQIAYSELYINEKYWPDFNKEDLKTAINWYKNRNRRFGAVDE